jgi:hypothetical protein
MVCVTNFRLRLADRGGRGRMGRGLGLRRFRLGFGGRGRFRRLLRGRGRRRLGEIGSILAVGEDHGDRRVDGYVGRAFRDQDLAERTLIGRLDFHRRLVGLDLGDDIAGLDRLAFLFQPFGEVALLHRGRQRRHQNLNGHGGSGELFCLSMILSENRSPLFGIMLQDCA